MASWSDISIIFDFFKNLTQFDSIEETEKIDIPKDLKFFLDDDENAPDELLRRYLQEEIDEIESHRTEWRNSLAEKTRLHALKHIVYKKELYVLFPSIEVKNEPEERVAAGATVG